MAYRRFAEEEGYTIEILDTTESETGGAKEVIMKIAGS
jgi:protein subunit release factor A